MLLDSNIIIYAAKPEHESLRHLIAEKTPAVSAVSYVEVLGYHQLSTPDREHYEAFFGEARILPVTQRILEEAVRLRQLKKMSLGDSLIAGTALVHDLTLVTRNTDDFVWIIELKVFNPFATVSPEPDEGLD